MRFKEFVNMEPMMSTDPTSPLKTPNLDMAPSGMGSFTALYDRLNQKKQQEKESLKRLWAKGNQLLASIKTIQGDPSNIGSHDAQSVFPYSTQLKLTPQFQNGIFFDIALDDLRKRNMSGGYVPALDPNDYNYAITNRIIVQQNNGTGTFDTNVLREKSGQWYSSYYGGSAVARGIDTGLNAIGSKAGQGSLAMRNPTSRVTA